MSGEIMSRITTDRDSHGRLSVRGRSRYADGHAVVLHDGQIVLAGDFGEPTMPAAVVDLLIETLHETRRYVTTPRIPDDAILLARCVTDDSIWATSEDLADPELAEELAGAPSRPGADIAVTVQGTDRTLVAAYTVHTSPLSPIGEDPVDVLERHGWRVVTDHGLDRWGYLNLVVERPITSTDT
ncbi:hypothetical protein [Nocardia sp. alder85J]|uniref:hypothetical protein n=1 Tax=Nocardia sp. alder85J TaxID=2862949 RepID=UPI001CD1C5BE|nr:hypothetical protein [Nocardia sp. alder85J]MCX4094532.1 hypothetical protein [Nocardia sp. alder85J]